MTHVLTIIPVPSLGFPMGTLAWTSLICMPSPSQGNTSKSILIMNFHPSAGENPPGPTTTDPFAPEALYELKIDTDSDAVADIAYRVRFSSSEGGAQTATLPRVDRPQPPGTGDAGPPTLHDTPAST